MGETMYESDGAAKGAQRVMVHKSFASAPGVLACRMGASEVQTLLGNVNDSSNNAHEELLHCRAKIEKGVSSHKRLLSAKVSCASS